MGETLDQIQSQRDLGRTKRKEGKKTGRKKEGGRRQGRGEGRCLLRLFAKGALEETEKCFNCEALQAR